MTTEAEAEITRLLNESLVLIRQSRDREAVERLPRVRALVTDHPRMSDYPGISTIPLKVH